MQVMAAPTLRFFCFRLFLCFRGHVDIIVLCGGERVWKTAKIQRDRIGEENNMSEKLRYTTLLLDADETLLDFNRTQDQALKETFGRFGLPFHDEIEKRYKELNQELWAAFERGAITKPELRAQRFRRLFDWMGVEDELAGFEEEYQLALGRGAFLLPNALQVCQNLSRDCRLYIVTNGVEATQHSRLEASGLRPYLTDVFVSEKAGFQKPQKEYLDYVFSRIPAFDKSRTLMVGDSLHSDMLGADRAGLDTCWFNPAGKTRESGIRICYEISSLEELYAVIRE